MNHLHYIIELGANPDPVTNLTVSNERLEQQHYMLNYMQTIDKYGT